MGFRGWFLSLVFVPAALFGFQMDDGRYRRIVEDFNAGDADAPDLEGLAQETWKIGRCVYPFSRGTIRAHKPYPAVFRVGVHSGGPYYDTVYLAHLSSYPALLPEAFDGLSSSYISGRVDGGGGSWSVIVPGTDRRSAVFEKGSVRSFFGRILIAIYSGAGEPFSAGMCYFFMDAIDVEE